MKNASSNLPAPTRDGDDARDVSSDLSTQETLLMPALDTVFDATALDATARVAGVMRDTASYEAASLSPELVDAEMTALAQALARWQAQYEQSYRETARGAKRFLPSRLIALGKRGVTSSTLNRWVKSPEQLSVAHFAALRAVVAALGHTMYDVADVMALARGRVLQARYGTQFVEDETAATLTRAQARWDAERELLTHFRALNGDQQSFMLAQARGLAATQRAQLARSASSDTVQSSSASSASSMSASSSQAAEEALASMLNAITRFEARALDARPRVPSSASSSTSSSVSPSSSGARRRRKVSAG